MAEPIDSKQEIQIARDTMLKARKVLQDYETDNGFAESTEHKKLTQAFDRASATYLRLLNSK